MAFRITSQLVMQAAEQRGWRVSPISEKIGLFSIELPKGEIFYVRSNTSYKGSGINSSIAKRKDLFYLIAKDLGYSLPATLRVTDLQDTREADAFLAEYGRIVVKPGDRAHGDGITVGVTTKEQLTAALARAAECSKNVLLQEQVIGDDYRLLFIGGKLAAAAIREPASVVGDGQHTTKELIEFENTNPKRGHGYETMMTHIDISAAELYLQERLNTIPAPNEKVQVVGVANIGKGGIAIDVTDNLPPGLLDQAQKVIDHFRLGLCGVDFLVDASGKAYLIETNVRPSFGLHEYPAQGKPRDTPNIFLDWLTAA